MTPIEAKPGANGEKCGCLIGAMICDSGPDERTHQMGTTNGCAVLVKRGFDVQYLVGLFSGFDADEKEDLLPQVLGYADGRAAREALVAAGMMEAIA